MPALWTLVIFNVICRAFVVFLPIDIRRHNPGIDGHLRKDAAPQKWPVLILDVDDAEADYLLAVVDPLAAMAVADAGALDALLSSVQSGEEAVQQMLAELAQREGIVPPDVDWKEYDESAADDVEFNECPECGYKWPK